MKQPVSAQPRQSYRQNKRLQIWKALESLLEEKPLKEISVQEICSRADIHRTTFYNHFYDVYDLLHFGSERMLESFPLESLPGSEIHQAAEFMAGFISRYRRVLLHMAETNDRSELLRQAKVALERFLTRALEPFEPLPLSAPLLARFFCGGLADMLETWIQDESLSAGEIHRQALALLSMAKQWLLTAGQENTTVLCDML